MYFDPLILSGQNNHVRNAPVEAVKTIVTNLVTNC